MYIEQGYKGKIGLWKYILPPGLFILFMIFNYYASVNSPVSADEAIRQLIDQLGSNITLIILLGPLAFGLLLILGWVKLVHEQTIVSLTTSRNKIDWKRMLFAFFLWGGITTAIVVIDYMVSPDHYELNFQLIPFLILLVISVLLIPLQTSFEEYMFRGYMMQGIGIIARNRWVPLVVTSVIFGLMHIGNPEVGKMGFGILIYYIGTGFFLGIITLMDEGLELALGFHAANNLFTALLVTADWTAFQTNSVLKDVSKPGLGFDVLFPIFVVFPILLFIFARKYRWTNWKQRLLGKVHKPEDLL